jgi:hypothetical protein
MTPSSVSFFRVAIVTPPAVSVKIPSVRARSFMPSMISASVTADIPPPLCRTTSRAKYPSAGFPMASDLAMVSGFTGLIVSDPDRNAAAMGEHPRAWAPDTRTCGSSSMRPTLASSSKPLLILVSCEPLAMGTTTWSGKRQPSCSAVSKARVFDPSA